MFGWFLFYVIQYHSLPPKHDWSALSIRDMSNPRAYPFFINSFSKDSSIFGFLLIIQNPFLEGWPIRVHW